MMRCLILILSIFPLVSSGQIAFDQYFLRKSLRLDFVLAGNDQETKVYITQMKEEPYWAGPISNLVDTFNYGTYKIELIEPTQNKLLFSKGFNTLFQEWQTTAEAQQIERAFYNCLVLPYPKFPVRFLLKRRDWNGDFTIISQNIINPNDYFILKNSTLSYEVVHILENGNPETHVDLVILPEGYKEEELDKFIVDARFMTESLFQEYPFNGTAHKFNVKALLIPSKESGTNIPGEGVYKNTALNATFYTFNIDRYLTVSDMKSVHDAAGSVPYDHIYVLVNTERYGGGGIYNFINVCSAGHPQSNNVFVHEFGHGFAGLGDEYYSSSVGYSEFYNLNVEPWEPNITTLTDFTSKWAFMVHDSIPVPTPRLPQYNNAVGVYEGGGYESKGIYSPFMNCRMKSNHADSFCPVCADAIMRRINFYCP